MDNAGHCKTNADEPELLWDTNKLKEVTGWSRSYIQQLCSNGTMPHIPGRPNKFIPAEVRKALVKMQVGGGYGIKKTRPRQQKEVK